MNCSHGELGLTEACEVCLGETRQTNYLLGQAIGLATAAELVALAVQKYTGSNDTVPQILTGLGLQLSLLAEEKRWALKPGVDVSPNMPEISE